MFGDIYTCIMQIIPRSFSPFFSSNILSPTLYILDSSLVAKLPTKKNIVIIKQEMCVPVAYRFLTLRMFRVMIRRTIIEVYIRVCM
jgi:hypothetical protein